MSTYTEVTQQIGDQWVAALKRVEGALEAVSGGIGDASAKIDLPKLPLPEQLAQATESLTAKIPQPSEVVAANFALAERLLAAQRDLTLRLLDAATPTAPAAE
jgi:hypothetical protein